MGFPNGSAGKESACNAEMPETQVWSLGREDAWRRGWQPIPVFLLGKSHGQGNLVGYGPWSLKESDTDETTVHARMQDTHTYNLPQNLPL